jgi:hypothetical protein
MDEQGFLCEKKGGINNNSRRRSRAPQLHENYRSHLAELLLEVPQPKLSIIEALYNPRKQALTASSPVSQSILCFFCCSAGKKKSGEVAAVLDADPHRRLQGYRRGSPDYCPWPVHASDTNVLGTRSVPPDGRGSFGVSRRQHGFRGKRRKRKDPSTRGVSGRTNVCFIQSASWRRCWRRCRKLQRAATEKEAAFGSRYWRGRGVLHPGSANLPIRAVAMLSSLALASCYVPVSRRAWRAGRRTHTGCAVNACA